MVQKFLISNALQASHNEIRNPVAFFDNKKINFLVYVV